MTTTSTFQGMNADGKPSSRVLNPPGGASNNIFGFDNEPQQRTPIKNNPDNVNRGNNDIFHQGPHAAAAPLPKSRAPRSAYNPITGEMYEQPKREPEPVSAPHSTEASKSERSEAAATSVDDQNSSSNSFTNEQKPQPEPAAAAPAAAPAPAAPQQQRQHRGASNIFGDAPEDPKDHRSTRVSQPPGGRSTKLW